MDFELAALVDEFRHHYELMTNATTDVQYRLHRAEVITLGEQLEDAALILNATQTAEFEVETSYDAIY